MFVCSRILAFFRVCKIGKHSSSNNCYSPEEEKNIIGSDWRALSNVLTSDAKKATDYTFAICMSYIGSIGTCKFIDIIAGFVFFIRFSYEVAQLHSGNKMYSQPLVVSDDQHQITHDTPQARTVYTSRSNCAL